MSARRLKKPETILIVNPSQLGDALSSFPLAGALRSLRPGSRTLFCSAAHVRPLVEACEHLDGFIALEDLERDPLELARQQVDVVLNLQSNATIARAARLSEVPTRVTNLRRWAGALDSNRFLLFSRSNARVHSVELNLKMLHGLGLDPACVDRDWRSLFGLSRIAPLAAETRNLLDPRRFNLGLHLKSGGHGREWPLKRFHELADMLSATRFKLFATGTCGELRAVRDECPELLEHRTVTNLMGAFDLPQFLAFVGAIDGMVASGTGPLHIAAALGKHAVGIYPPRRSMDARKWAPIGPRAESITREGGCTRLSWKCRNAPDGPPCACTAAVSAAEVFQRVSQWGRQQDRAR